ncbi:hypothetical protein ACFVGN_44180 [Streptomyces sp. NPDC057757]|uniref:hypothetical protein n=1 Tax=Streptomyces sp. NPDC057757 TaxID=3346241 RepID=UPI003695E007
MPEPDPASGGSTPPEEGSTPGSVPVWHPDRYPRPIVTDDEARDVLHALWAQARHRDATPVEVRRALFATMSRQWGARPGELCELRTTDFEPGWRSHAPVRRPQGRTSAGLLTETVYATDEIRYLLKKWLPVRRSLVDPLSGGEVYHLFVTTWANHRFGKKYKTGLPLRPFGAERDWRAFIELWNADGAGTRPPLPIRLEAWRRGGRPLPEDSEPDAARRREDDAA